jgi:hypothetical protein
VGDKLSTRIFGPHSIASFTTEWRAYIFTAAEAITRHSSVFIVARAYEVFEHEYTHTCSVFGRLALLGLIRGAAPLPESAWFSLRQGISA